MENRTDRDIGLYSIFCLLTHKLRLVFHRFTGEVLDAYQFCKEHPYPAWFHPVFREIILCPAFFTFPATPTRSQCLTVNRWQNDFYQDGRSMIFFQVWIMMHQLVHHYLENPGTHKNPRAEVYKVNQCVRLSSTASVQNAGNYVYYAASKSLTTPYLIKFRYFSTDL